MNELCITAMLMLLSTLDAQQDAHNRGWTAKVETYERYIQEDIINVTYKCKEK